MIEEGGRVEEEEEEKEEKRRPSRICWLISLLAC
jgi:hypothetical protein